MIALEPDRVVCRTRLLLICITQARDYLAACYCKGDYRSMIGRRSTFPIVLIIAIEILLICIVQSVKAKDLPSGDGMCLALAQHHNDAQAILEQLNAKLKSAQSLQVKLILNPGPKATTFDVSFAKPDRYLVRSSEQGFVRDGTVERMWFVGQKTYYQLPLSNPPLPPFLCVGLEAFFDGGKTFLADSVEPTTLDGVKCQKLILSKPKVPGIHWALYLNEEGLPIGYEQNPDDTKLPLLNARYQSLILNKKISQTVFNWSSAGYKLETKFGAEIPTLEVGASAPKVQTTSLSGQQVSLNDMFRGKKAVLLNFWFVGCAPCRHEFPHLQDLYKRFEKDGLAVIGVDRGDSADQVRAFLNEKKADFPIVLDPSGDAVAGKFKVNAFPTTFLLDSDGKIRAVIVGENDTQLDTELAKLGFQ